METTQSSHFIDLVNEYESLKEKMDEVRTKLQESLLTLGIGTYLQDPVTTTVFKVVKPTGSFVYYKDVDYVRTAKEGERAGSLSMKEATEKGFIVIKK